MHVIMYISKQRPGKNNGNLIQKRGTSVSNDWFVCRLGHCKHTDSFSTVDSGSEIALISQNLGYYFIIMV